MNRNSFFSSFVIQKRVVYALLMREMITRYGRKNIGFLWLILDPMIVTLLFTAIWYVQNLNQTFKLPITIFVLTGYGSRNVWSSIIGRSINAISANAALLYHRNVKIMDVITSRIIMEAFGSIGAFLFIYLFFLWFGVVEYPSDIFEIFMGFFLLIWFSAALGILLGILSERYELISKFWGPVSLILMMISGTFFMVDWLPYEAQEIVLWIPIVHCIEIIREGFLGSGIHAYYSYGYVVIFNIIATYIALLFERSQTNRIEL